MADDWKTVDDRVMGGVSASRIEWVDGSGDRNEPIGWLRFFGEVSLENNGGFCSTRQVEARRQVPDITRLRYQYRGDGKRYKWLVRTAGTPKGASWRLRFETSAGLWEMKTYELGEFELWRRGTLLSKDGGPEPNEITSLGILISDGQAGSFRFDLARIEGDAR